MMSAMDPFVRAHGIGRVDPTTLVARLAAAGLPVFEAVRDFEQHIGDGVALIEHFALRDAALALSAGGVEVQLPGRAGGALARALDCAHAPEASCRLLSWWIGAGVVLLEGHGRLHLFTASIADAIRALEAALVLWPDARAAVSTPRARRERRDADDAPTLPPYEGAILAYAGRPGEQGEVRLRTGCIEQIAWLGGRLDWAVFTPELAVVRSYNRV